MEKKITKIDKFDAAIAVLKEADAFGSVEFLEEEKERYLARQAKAKERNAKKKSEADKMVEVVEKVMEQFSEPVTRTEITEAVIAADVDGIVDVTEAKVGNRLTKLVKAGKVVKESKTIDKKRKMVYVLAAFDEDGDEEEAVDASSETALE